MGKKAISSKSKIMSLASGEANKDSPQMEEWLENEPTLDSRSTNLFEELCNATKEGDLEKTESLVKNFGAPINLVDSWQCTPLYYACLCGHYEVVKFLLENGAQCDPNTFSGERCLYGALNDKIRRLLRSYKFSKAINENQPYFQFLTDLFNNHPYHDLTFLIRARQQLPGTDTSYEEFPAHRFVLAARSTYFRSNLIERWRNDTKVKLASKHVDASAFRGVLQYIYTGEIADINRTALENMAFVARHLELHELQARCEEILQGGERYKKNANRAQDAKEMARIRSDYETFLRRMLKTAAKIKRTSDGTVHATERWLNDGDAEGKEDPEAVFADIAIVLDNVLFLCHKACLCRSEYFNIMLGGAFSESELESTLIRYEDKQLALSLVELHEIPPEIFPCILEYLYTDRCTIPVDQAYDVLLISDMLRLERLKSIAAITLTNQKEPVIDIYELTRTSVELNVDRLEQWCIQYFANHLDDFIHEPEFKALIRESAQSIAGRQETDSIPFIDDLRYFLGKKYCIFEEELNPEGRVDEEYRDEWTDLEGLYNEKLEMLDRVLESLGLEA